MALTMRQKQKYLRRKGGECPKCQASEPYNFEPAEMNFEGDENKMGRKMECMTCGLVYWEIYFVRLYGVRGDDEIR